MGLGGNPYTSLLEILNLKGASRCSGCVTGHPSPPDAFALATMIAFGGPGRPASAAAHPYAVHPSSHNDLTPLRSYRGLIGFALLSMPLRLKVELKEESWGDDPEYNLNGLRMYGQHWIGKQGHYPISFVDRQKSKK